VQELLLYGLCGAVLFFPLLIYLRKTNHTEQTARQLAEQSEFASAQSAMHPHIDVSNCIGCQGCTTACPEGGVLGMVGGKAAVVRPQRCIGHGLCAEACPVGAIQLLMAKPGMSADLPFLTPNYETSVPNLFIAGELGGLALIKNAVLQGRECIDTIAERLAGQHKIPAVYDVVIVGAGPAGISASLRAIERGLNYVTLERELVGGATAKYPRQKLVMATRVELPLYGPLKKSEFSKEHLVDLWSRVTAREDFRVIVHENVEDIQRNEHGSFVIRTSNREYLARAVVVAMGRSGTPRKLGVKGEELPKVMYRLLEADHYVGQDLLVVGGGDSAIEAAMGLARQKGNRVTISYRRSEFVRLKERNLRRLSDFISQGSIEVLFNSAPLEFTERTAILDVAGERREISNDFTWIFAGGVAPNEFLKKIGVAFGSRDLIRDAASIGV
jgi:thioredoxin reductase/Pyruvate/2-oxoacid:ferredoxin oxidoreductase delta subunit